MTESCEQTVDGYKAEVTGKKQPDGTERFSFSITPVAKKKGDAAISPSVHYVSEALFETKELACTTLKDELRKLGLVKS